MAEPFLGQIMIFAGNFAPRGWALCNGQLLAISQNTALFSILGTYYGGNGTTTFALPNLQGRVPIHSGNGTGLSPYVVGQNGGTETVTLLTTQMPSHTHLANVDGAASGKPTPSGNFLGTVGGTSQDKVYSSGPSNATMNATAIGAAGGSQPHANIEPYLALTFCIATQGIFPSRN
jgi:microcystin-dependent protein